MRETHITLLADDGQPLAATLCEPEGAARAAILINSATAVPRRYYRPYAEFLTTRGFAVLSYDYRGIGDSVTPRQAPRQLRMRHWGERDIAAALRWLDQQYPRLKIAAIGHSAGGQLLGLAPNNGRIAAALMVGSQSGYRGHWPRSLQPFLLALWHGLVPLTVACFGRLPAAVLGHALPGGVALQWAHWCLQPEYITDRSGRPIRDHFGSFTGPLRLYAISDDWVYAPLTAVRALARFYPRAQADVRVLRPGEFGRKRIGHFGFFRSSMPRPAWVETAEWLENALSLTSRDNEPSTLATL